MLGADAGDNVTFVWNFWWMRAALEQGRDFFQTSYLFAPWGVDLTLHTHTALAAFLGATMFGSMPVVTALNATVIASAWLNGLSAYLLAWRVTRNASAAAIGGLIFAGSPFVSAHLHGHFNLTTAWTVPLFALAAYDAIARGALVSALAAGLVLGLTAYVDYYFVVFQAAFVVGLVVFERRAWQVALAPPRRWSAVQVALLVLICADIVHIVAVLATGGYSFTIAGTAVSARGVFNPLQALWIVVAILFWIRLRPRVSSTPHPTPAHARTISTVLAIAGIATVAAAPVIAHAAGVLGRGDYETQRYLWRNAPKGVDLATLVAGNPFHPLWGGVTSRIYDALDISAIESCAWLGVIPTLLAGWVLRAHRSSHVVRTWAALGGAFFLWALGPHLMAFGVNTGLILPQVLMRYVPIVSNARVPGRAMVMVYLALSVLCAVAVTELQLRFRRGALLTAIAGAAIFADYLPAPFPLLELKRPAVYDTLAQRRETGAVCELPLGIRDGFGEAGSLDERVLFYQSIHGRPIAGGFVARLPQRIRLAYQADPLFSALLRLSEAAPPHDAVPSPDAAVSRERLRAHGIGFIVLDKRAAPAALIEYVRRLPLSPIADDGERELFVVVQ